MTTPDRTYEIQEVAELTGLAPGRLRAWERRYAAVRPTRQPNGYRRYTAEQVALLRAFARRVAAGERIGDLVGRSVEAMLVDDAREEPTSIGELVEAVRALDRDRLEALVAQQLALRGPCDFAAEVVRPLAQRVGDLWALGQITIAAEHLASEVVVPALKQGLRLARGGGPLLVAACVAGERHEWGVLGALAELQERGWRIQYLGPDLPVAEVAEAAWRLQPAGVALSVSDPGVLARQLESVIRLPDLLPPGTRAALGGGGIESHARLLRSHGYLVEREVFEAAARG